MECTSSFTPASAVHLNLHLGLHRNQKQLDSMSGEYQTRERSMESLKIAAQNPGMAERSALLAGSAHGAAASAGGAGGETQRSRDMTNQQMMAQFEKDTVEQDAILDEIGQGVDRIGVIGQHIGDETDKHQVRRVPRTAARMTCKHCPQRMQMLLDDIEDSMDTAHGKLRQGEKFCCTLWLPPQVLRGSRVCSTPTAVCREQAHQQGHCENEVLLAVCGHLFAVCCACWFGD